MEMPHAAHLEEVIHFISPGADEAYEYSWQLVPGSTPMAGAAVDYAYHELGTYEVTLTVTDSLNDVSNVLSQQIVIIPMDVPIPALSIVANPSVHEGQELTLSVGSPDDQFAYLWDFADGVFESGASVNHIFNLPGTYGVVLRATPRDSGTVFTSPAYNIYVIQEGEPLPSLSLIMPYSAQINQAVVFRFDELTTDQFDYTLDFGDVDPISLISSDPVSHPYAATGTYQVRLTATSVDDASVFYQQAQNIAIVPYPVPNVGIDGPTHATLNMFVSFSVNDPTPGATYTWECGNGVTTGTGTSISCSYSTTGRKQVNLTGNNAGTINTSSYPINIHE
jgi:PKD repeat protein